MNINLNASLYADSRFFNLPTGAVMFNTKTSQPGPLVYSTGRGGGLSTVRNTPEDRKTIRAALASHLPKFSMWTAYIGDINKALGVRHYWEIPSEKLPEVLKVIDSLFKTQPVLFPSYSQTPKDERLENAGYELEAVLSQFEAYRKWFREQAELMDFAINSVTKTLETIK